MTQEHTRSEIDSLINTYFDEEITAAELQELSQWIQSDPANARRFAEAVMLHDRLQGELAAASELPAVGKAFTAESRHQNSRSLPRKVVTVLVLTLCLLVSAGISLWQSKPQIPVDSPAFLTLAQATGVEWVDGNPLEKGQRIGKQLLAITTGLIRLQFDDGVEVTVQGPARFETISPGVTRLHTGLLAATVPPGAEGFQVHTPHATVTDLGTRFGVNLNQEGHSDISVFEGEVVVELPNSTEEQRLLEGEALRVDADRLVKTVEFDDTAYTKVWPVSSGIERFSGAFRLIPPWRKRLRFVRSDTDIFVRPEGYAISLQEPLHVNISQPGEYQDVGMLTPAILPEGQFVRSILLHYHPREARPPHQSERISGSITFDRPVLGLIVLHPELAASAFRFSHRPAGEIHERRQLEFFGVNGDSVRLSEDRRTLFVDLASPRLTSDLVRVILDASSASSPSD